MTTIRIVPFERSHAHEAAAIFVAAVLELLDRVPAMPGDLSDVEVVAGRLERMTGVAAMNGEDLAGYLTAWFPIQGFRDTARIGAYVPEWAHGAAASGREGIYRELYRAASSSWSRAGCDLHAITLLAHQTGVTDAWFWNGFGMGTVDAVRPMTPIGFAVPQSYRVRAASPGDAPDLAVLDAEHVRHYAEPPVNMVPPTAFDEAGWVSFLSEAGNAAWLAEDADGPFGFIRLGPGFDGSDVIASSEGAFISGASVRPEHRGRGAASAMLDGALRAGASAGLRYCAVDFEGFNPEATVFWTRHFTPVCISLMRVPEVP